MVESDHSIYPLDSNKKMEKRISLKTKVYQNLSIETKKNACTTIMINIYYNKYIAQASFCDGFHSYF